MHDDAYVAHLSSTRVICTMPILYAISTRAHTTAPERRIFLSRPTVHCTRLSIAPARASPPTTPRARAPRTRHHPRREFRLPAPSPRALESIVASNPRSQRGRAAIKRRTRSAHMANPVVFFDIEIGGAPAGRIEMTVRTRCLSRVGDAIDRRAEGRRECDRIR